MNPFACRWRTGHWKRPNKLTTTPTLTGWVNLDGAMIWLYALVNALILLWGFRYARRVGRRTVIPFTNYLETDIMIHPSEVRQSILQPTS